MDAETRRAKEQMKDLPFKERARNFWYYYRYHIIVGAVVCMALAMSIVQCVTRIDYDLSVSMYSASYVSTERKDALVELFTQNCVDVTGNEKVEVLVDVNEADIQNPQMSEMAVGIYSKLMAEMSANSSGGYVVDEMYKNQMINNYQYPAENVIDLSLLPDIKAKLQLADNEKLYWLPAFDRGGENKKAPDQFDNAKNITQMLKNSVQ